MKPRTSIFIDTKELFPLLLVCLLGLTLYPLAANAQSKDQPNIILILADDMGYDAVSAYNPAMGPLKTPFIDRLCSEGMTFYDAHSGSAVCTPTRYGLLTGRYCWRTRLKKEVLWDYGRPLIEDERLTVAEMLKAKGYQTAMVGKWHLGLDWYQSDGSLANDHLLDSDAIWRKGEPKQRVERCERQIDWSKPISGGPLDHGFDYWFGVDLPNMPPYAWIENRKLTALPSVPKPKEMFGNDGPMVPGWKLEDILPKLGEKSVEWIQQQSKQDKPFFLYVPLTSPHTPISPSAEFQGKSKVSPFADFIIETDWVTGQIVKAVDDAGIADNTIIIFTADNGTASAARFGELKKKGVDLKHTLKGQKGSLDEGGHRVPFVVRWPSVVRKGSKCYDMVGLNDFMASVADIVAADLPQNAAEDSVSILPLLKGDVEKLTDRPLLVHHNYQGDFAIRGQRWKLVLKDGIKLYDMQEDLKETNNLADQHPKVVKNLQKFLELYKSQGRSVFR